MYFFHALIETVLEACISQDYNFLNLHVQYYRQTFIADFWQITMKRQKKTKQRIFEEGSINCQGIWDCRNLANICRLLKNGGHFIVTDIKMAL
jgi:hypothetical protein